MTKNYSTYSLLALSVMVLTLVGYQFLAAQVWTPPTAPPPGANVPAPIHVGSAAQAKAGDLGAVRIGAAQYCNQNFTVCYDLSQLVNTGGTPPPPPPPPPPPKLNITSPISWQGLHGIAELRANIRANLGPTLDSRVPDGYYDGNTSDQNIDSQTGCTMTTWAYLGFRNDAPTRNQICAIIGTNGGVDGANPTALTRNYYCPYAVDSRGARYLQYNGSSWVLTSETSSNVGIQSIDCN